MSHGVLAAIVVCNCLAAAPARADNLSFTYAELTYAGAYFTEGQVHVNGAGGVPAVALRPGRQCLRRGPGGEPRDR